MSLDYVVRPISDRTPFTGSHEYTPFDSAWSSTLHLLGRELDALKAVNVVLEIDVLDGQLRLDGTLRAKAKAASPAVRLAFESRVGPLVYATDRYVSRWYEQGPDWQQNVRAIALALEALRKVDRYGVTKRGEQYAGWKAIEATPSGMGKLAAWDVIAAFAGIGPDEDVTQATAYKRARANAHPDRNDGNRNGWDQVETAGRVLGLS